MGAALDSSFDGATISITLNGIIGTLTVTRGDRSITSSLDVNKLNYYSDDRILVVVTFLSAEPMEIAGRTGIGRWKLVIGEGLVIMLARRGRLIRQPLIS